VGKWQSRELSMGLLPPAKGKPQLVRRQDCPFSKSGKNEREEFRNKSKKQFAVYMRQLLDQRIK